MTCLLVAMPLIVALSSALSTETLLLPGVTPLYAEPGSADSENTSDKKQQAAREFFEARIRPVLIKHCIDCHNSQGTAEGGLILDHASALRKGGESGPLIHFKNPKQSLLLKVLRHQIEGLEMPAEADPLPASVISDFEKWISTGAFDPREIPLNAQPADSNRGWPAEFKK